MSNIKKTTSFLPRMIQILSQGMSGIRPKVPVRLDLLEETARDYIPKGPFSYISSGSGRENVVHKNHEAFLKWSIVPETLTDVSSYDTSIQLFGKTHPYPFLLAPVGALDLAHPEAESAAARAAAAEGIAMGFSSMASTPMETVAAAMANSTRWYQLYWTNRPEYNESLVKRAHACGCTAIMITVDTKIVGWRAGDLSLGYSATQSFSGLAQFASDPVFNRYLDESIAHGNKLAMPKITFSLLSNFLRMCWRAPWGFFHNLKTLRPVRTARLVSEIFADGALNWDDIAILRKQTKLPILIKGILSPKDSKKALEYGVDGIIVSNHGGRQLSGAITALDALPGIVEVVQGKIPVLMDSGIRGGADVFKAIALGANAVLIGRPYVYALAIAGEDGVREMIQNVKEEFEVTMLLAGCTRVSEINRDKLFEND